VIKHSYELTQEQQNVVDAINSWEGVKPKHELIVVNAVAG